MFRRLMLVVLLLIPVFAHAHWTDHKELPDWAQRGKLRWCLNYARADRKLVDLFLEANQTLLHGGSFDSPETAEYARQRGLRYMPYVCSRTVTTAEIAKNPQLKGAVVLNPDGSDFLAYNNPVRRYGSLYQAAWPEYVRARTRQLWDLPDVGAIFYDNAFFVGNDYNPATVAAWQKWAIEHGLPAQTPMPVGPSDPLYSASHLFSSESLTDYHRGLQQFCHSHNPPLPNCPNLGSGAGLESIEAGAVDLVFYETMSHPPFDNNFYIYKVGLAASHGRPTSMLAYLPEAVGSERGTRTWNEGMHSYFYPSSPIAEEFALAAAEANAVNAIYIPCYNLFPSLPITDMTDPFNKRIYRELKRSYDFQKANENLYAASQPGSEIAILHSTLTNLQNRRAQNGPALSKALLAAGIPYEVVVASDLPTGLGPTRTLIVPSVSYMDEPTAAGLLRFIEQGGRALLTGECGTLDPLGRLLNSPSMRKINDALRLTSRPVQQWTLNGMEPEGASTIRVIKGQGSASTTFDGQAGDYVAYLTLTDESDGTSPFALSVNGKPVFSSKLDFEDDQPHVFRTPAFPLKPGDIVQLNVQADAGEMGRVQSVLLTAADAASGASLGAGRVSYCPSGLEGLSAADLVTLLQPRTRLLNPGKVSINLMASPAQKIQEIHLVNYDFHYEVNHPGRYASDDGTAEKRTYFGNPATVLRKTIHIDKPDTLVDPILRIQGYATPATTADLVVTINSKPAGRIVPATIRGWAELPLDPALLSTDNLIEVRVDGEVDGQQKWIQVGIDTDATTANSFFSTDGGKTFSTADLSPDRKAQTGEYLIRIEDRSPGGERASRDNLVRNGTFEQLTTPHSETKLTVVPAQNVQIQVQGPVQSALAISPEHEPLWIRGQPTGKVTTYTVPTVDIYTVLLLAPTPQGLQGLYRDQRAAAPWSVPPVTEPLRSTVDAWEAFGDGFAMDKTCSRGGSNSIRCENAAATDLRGAVETLELNATTRQTYTATAWSRADNVSGAANADYSLYIDATCTDGSVFNGHSTPFATGTHDWQQVKLEITPPAPLKSLRLYVLFRKRTGRVWFDDVQMRATPAAD